MLSKPLIGATLKPLVLSLLANGPKYGFQITYNARILAGDQVSWSNSKLYPLLHRLEHDGLVKSFWRPSTSGPDRKYYQLTKAGHKALSAAKHEWKVMNAIFAKLWDPDLAVA